MYDPDDEVSEDVMDLDGSQVLNFLDINHEFLPRDEGVGFDEWMEQRLDAIEEDEDLINMLDSIEAEDIPESVDGEDF